MAVSLGVSATEIPLASEQFVARYLIHIHGTQMYSPVRVARARYVTSIENTYTREFVKKREWKIEFM
jgi:hypothetical protein